MYTLSKSENLKPLMVQERLSEMKLFFITPRDFSRIFNVSAFKTKYFLENYAKKGFLVRIKRGIYALAKNLPREEMIANSLCRPSYVSFEYALAYYNLIPEIIYTVTSATTKQARKFSFKHIAYSYIKVKKKAFMGYKLEKIQGGEFFIAEPEKAMADYLYLAAIGHRKLNERLKVSEINREKIKEYAKLYENDKIIKIFEKLCSQEKQLKS